MEQLMYTTLYLSATSDVYKRHTTLYNTQTNMGTMIMLMMMMMMMKMMMNMYDHQRRRLTNHILPKSLFGLL